MAQAVVVFVCDICGTDQDVQLYCMNCEEYLCANCNIYHSKGKKTRNDTVITISEARQENVTKTPVILCEEHSSMEVTLYCKKCEKLICSDCLSGKHKNHGITSLKEIKSSAKDELVKIKKTLLAKKSRFQDAIKADGKVFSEYMAAIEKCKKDIYGQKDKIIQELNSICEEEVSELTTLQATETKKYSDACTDIQTKGQVVTSALQTVQNGIDSGHPATMLKAKEDATKITQGLDDPEPLQVNTPEFQQANIERQAIRQQMGSKIFRIAKPKQQTPSSANKHQQSTSDQSTYRPNVSKREIDVKKVRVKSSITAKRICHSVRVIVPTRNNAMWVAGYGEKHLTLINSNGDIIKESVTVSEKTIHDAKEYNNDILITCKGENKVIRVSGEGARLSTFSDLTPYKTRGLCVTNAVEVLVCLLDWSYEQHRVVRLGSDGRITQTIQWHTSGALLYILPSSVTALPTGEIIVVNMSGPRKLRCVDSKGQNVFTWNGEVTQRRQSEISRKEVVTGRTHSKISWNKDVTGKKSK